MWVYNPAFDEWHAVHETVDGQTACHRPLDPKWEPREQLPADVSRYNVDRARLCWACARVKRRTH